MQKKIFLEKNTQPTGKQSYVKALLFATIGLVVLAVVIPTFMRPQNPRQLSMERAFEKGGMVKREIPKSFMPSETGPPLGELGEKFRDAMENTPSAPLEGKTAPDAQEGKIAPAPQASSSTAPGMALNETQQNAEAAGWKSLSQDPKPAGAETASVGGGTDKALKEAAPVPETEKGTASGVTTALPGALPTEQKKELPAKLSPTDKKALKQAVLAVPAPSTAAGDRTEEGQEQKPTVPKKESYAVQVGSYKEKQNAEEMRQSLQEKGYTVVVRSQNHPKLGQLYVVQLQPVKDAGKANTLMAQIQNVANVKPVIVKVPAAQ